MRKILGGTLLALPAAAWMIIVSMEAGVVGMLVMLAIALAVVACIIGGVELFLGK